MIKFPCAKINLGLNIVSKRSDGYHNLETVFYPIPLYDALEIKYMDEKFPSENDCDLKVSGNAIECDENNNLVIKAYKLIAEDYKLPRVHAHLSYFGRRRCGKNARYLYALVFDLDGV